MREKIANCDFLCVAEGRIATRLRYGWKIDECFVASLLLSPAV